MMKINALTAILVEATEIQTMLVELNAFQCLFARKSLQGLYKRHHLLPQEEKCYENLMLLLILQHLLYTDEWNPFL